MYTRSRQRFCRVDPYGDRRRCGSRNGFTVVELLVVTGLILVLMALLVPTFSGLRRGSEFTSAIYDIADMMESTRSFAVANNTYAWMGFAETDANRSPGDTQVPGIGRVIIAAVASKDGSKNYSAYDGDTVKEDWKRNYEKPSPLGTNLNGSNFIPLGIHMFENMHIPLQLGAPPASGPMARPPLIGDYRFGTASSRSNTPFVYPPGQPLNPSPGAKAYYFDKVLSYDPQGCARVLRTDRATGVEEWMEIGLQQTRGAVDPGPPTGPNIGNQAAILVNGLTGAVRVYRP